ncbi:acyl carrier protein [Burkholderia aenigmatica]|uniref:Acyl carrier protein n=1 Tax=Burkholderia aenigmatica TaxID=2015348 RepID=A0A6P2KLH9_9BURK|nr:MULTISPECIES: DUF1493 family protein [Burkholderia]VWB57574.1 acyl carrier protein [Burkholderia aenigmatica]HDR9483547.1 DUF1493 family protein [Burkholderia aenigmatica]HDR9488536.1 DUF1493 family protein [Burkholderia aenigmatica]HDR9514496.1 DUF1493 family protein [Burkholderia aenigmatica]HDR9520302.1 DUF1493 family protein [Burkholderia aenigmatica]
MVDSWESLEQFVATDAGKPLVGRLELTRDTDLYHDLDLEPDRIDKLVRRWAVEFGVDLSAFDIHYYYPAAKLGIGSFLAAVVKSPFSTAARETLGGRSLTLGMMEEAMERGRWEA